jgi:probable HAF family extracellular repeat protein
MLYDGKTVVSLAPLIGNPFHSIAVAVNNRGQLAVRGAGLGYFIDGIEVKELGYLGEPSVNVFGINEAGQVTGYAHVGSNRYRAFRWTSGE